MPPNEPLTQENDVTYEDIDAVRIKLRPILREVVDLAHELFPVDADEAQNLASDIVSNELDLVNQVEFAKRNGDT